MDSCTGLDLRVADVRWSDLRNCYKLGKHRPQISVLKFLLSLPPRAQPPPSHNPDVPVSWALHTQESNMISKLSMKAIFPHIH